MRLYIISILLSMVALAATDQAPGYEGFDLIWEDTFSGPAGSLPDQSKWIMQDWYKNLNGDFQTYTTSRANQQHTGHGSLIIIPLRDPSAQRGWTSGRLESTYTFTPAPGAKTIAEAQIKLGSATKSGKQGIWPAFWLLGDSHRKGSLIWPTCGEIDILENVNGEPKTQGVIHCDKNPGGICNEKNGIAGALDLPDSGRNFHTYTAMIDRTPGDWRQESVSFFVDGRQYHRVTGARIGNEEVWGKVAHNLVHFILNVAVGGEWPGDPNESTVSGIGNAMEVKYVAHYQSQGAGGSRPPSYGSGGYDPIPQPQPGPQYPEPPAPPHVYVPQPPSPHYPYDPEPQFPGPYGPPYEQAPDYPWEQPPRQGRPKVPKPHSPYVPYDQVPEPPSPHYPYDPEPPSHRRPKEDYGSCSPHGPPGPEHDPHKKCRPQTPPHHVPESDYPENPAYGRRRPVPPGFPDHPPPSLPHIPYLPDLPQFPDVYPPRPGPPFPGHHKRTENLSAVRDHSRPSRSAPVMIGEEQNNGPEPFYPNQPHPPPTRELIEPIPQEVPGSPQPHSPVTKEVWDTLFPPVVRKKYTHCPPRPDLESKGYWCAQNGNWVFSQTYNPPDGPNSTEFTMWLYKEGYHLDEDSGHWIKHPRSGHHKRTDDLGDGPRTIRPAPVAVDEERNGPEPFYPNQGGAHPAPGHEVIETVPEIPGHPRPANDGQGSMEIPPSAPDFPPHVDYQQPQQPSHGPVPPQTGPPQPDLPPQHSQDIQVPEEISPPTPDFPQGDYHQPQEPSPKIGGDSSSPCPPIPKGRFGWGFGGRDRRMPSKFDWGVGGRDRRVPSKFNVRGLAASRRNASEPAVVQLSMPNRFKTPNYPNLAPDATAPPTVRPGDFGGVQAEDMVEKRDLPNRFKTPNYPTLPLDGTPPTVRSGNFGGVQAEDVHKYLDKNVSDPRVAKRSLPKPPNYPCLPPDSIRPPTVRSGDPSCVHPRDVGNHVDEPIPSQSAESNDTAPSDVRPVEFSGVQPEDIREFIEKNGPYHIEIPNNSTNASEALATPTAQPDPFKGRGLIGVLREKYGIEHTKREDGDKCLIGFPVFGRCIPSSKHPQAPSIIESLIDRFGTKFAKREDKEN